MSSFFPDDKWTIGEGEINGSPLIARIRSSTPLEVDRKRVAQLMIVSWEYEPTTSGMPASDTYNKMRQFEDALESGTEANGVAYQVVSLTGGGKKEWRFYTSDPQEFLDSLNADLAGHEPYPIEIAAFEDAEWKGLSEIRAIFRENDSNSGGPP